jgi:nucleotide-binding universal stress UspA family protein
VFGRLLIPLDGSNMSEAVLPPAGWFARTFGSSVTLIHVIERDAPASIHNEPHLQEPAEARQYLERVAKDFFGSGTRVSIHVHDHRAHDVAESIADHAEEFESDMIFMADHGDHRLSRWLSGSLAQKVASIDTTPLFLMRPGKTPRAETSWTCDSLLVPLDSSGQHDRALGVAKAIAGAAQATVHLLHVEETFESISGPFTTISRLLPTATSRLLDAAAEEAGVYLQQQADALGNESVASSSVVRRGDPAREILAAAAEKSVDCIVLGTHGKHGLDAFWSGSVVSKVCTSCETPLVLVPVA